MPAEFALTKEPVYEGEPILAIAADSEELAAEAIDRIVVTFEALPHVIDPLEGLRPGSPNGREQGNVFVGPSMRTLKWTAADMALVDQGKFPSNAEAAETLTFGDIETGFKEADLIVERDMHQQTTSHQPLESRSAMAYWQNGKCYLHVSTQSLARTVAVGCGLGRRQARRARADQRVHRRRLRQQDSGRAVDGDPGADVEEAQRPSGDDAHLARGRDLHRPRASRLPGLDQDGLQEGRPGHGDRHVHRRSLRSVSPPGRSLDDGEPRLAVVPGAEHALPRHLGGHQHAAGRLAARAGRPAGVGVVRAADA